MDTNYINSVSSNEVLKKTYFLLAMSLIPTVLGTAIGMELGIMKAIYQTIGAFGFFIAYLVGSFLLFIGIRKAGDTPLGITLLMIFTFISGVLLSTLIERTLNIPNGAVLIGTAFAGTAGIFAGMSILNTFLKRDLGFLGKGLFIAIIALLCASFLFIFFPSGLFYILLMVATLVIFSVYLLYDLNQIILGGETSYVNATLSLYIDLINIFRSLLALLGIFGRSDD